jgi:vacuolar-type H+-ATPase subunit I/STV1
MTTQQGDLTTPLADDATADEFAAAAERHRQAETQVREHAAHDQAEAEEILAAAKAEAARIMAEAEASAGVLAKSAKQATYAAGELDNRARSLDIAASKASDAEEAEARAAALEEERDELAAAAEGIDRRLGELARERQQLEAELAAATDSADLDVMTNLRNRLGSIADVVRLLTGRRDAARARLKAIGDGTETFGTHPALQALPPLAEERRQADMARSGVIEVLDQVWPDSPQAVHRAAAKELRLTIEAQRQRIAEEAAASPQQRRGQVITR